MSSREAPVRGAGVNHGPRCEAPRRSDPSVGPRCESPLGNDESPLGNDESPLRKDPFAAEHPEAAPGGDAVAGERSDAARVAGGTNLYEPGRPSNSSSRARWIGGGLIALIRVYQAFLSPVLRSLGTQCRFHPTCSAYAIEVLRKDGAWRGSWRAVLRILRCHPWHPGGFDPP